MGPPVVPLCFSQTSPITPKTLSHHAPYPRNLKTGLTSKPSRKTNASLRHLFLQRLLVFVVFPPLLGARPYWVLSRVNLGLCWALCWPQPFSTLQVGNFASLAKIPWACGLSLGAGLNLSFSTDDKTLTQSVEKNANLERRTCG